MNFRSGDILNRIREIDPDSSAGALQEPAAGCIRLGNVDVRDFGESDLRRHISVVAQQPHMFNATLRENLLMARPGAGDDELRAALNSAQLLNFVTTLPDGLDTWIGRLPNFYPEARPDGWPLRGPSCTMLRYGCWMNPPKDLIRLQKEGLWRR